MKTTSVYFSQNIDYEYGNAKLERIKISYLTKCHTPHFYPVLTLWQVCFTSLRFFGYEPKRY